MTREMAMQNLKALGIEEPSKEQIDSYLNSFSGEIKKEKDLAEKYKADALKVSDLQAQLDALNSQNLSDIERAQQEMEKANGRVADLEKQIKDMQVKKALAEKGIVGEDAEKLFGADGSLDIEMLGQIISDRVTQAKAQAEKDLLNGTPNPTGSNKDNGNEKSAEDLLVESIANDFAGVNKGASDIVAKYE